MKNVTLRQLRYFDALNRLRHFGRAAELCNVSQPALSAQIRELEASLGAPLFDRGPRRLTLTGVGEALATRVEGILRAVDDLEDVVRAAREGPVARLRLGVIPTVAPYLLPRLIAALTRSHPGLDLHLRETHTQRLIDEMAQGRLDAALVALPVSEGNLTEVPLLTEEFVLVRPAADATLPVPGPESLRRMRLLLLEEGHCFRDQALALCNLQSAPPRELLDASSLSTLVQMVAAGIGVTLIPEMAVPVETRSAAVSVARFGAPRPERQIGMVWRRGSPLDRQLGQIAEILQAAVAGGRPEGARVGLPA